MVNHQRSLTRNIRKPGDVGKLNLCTFTQNCSGLKSLKPSVAYLAYTLTSPKTRTVFERSSISLK